MSTHRQIVNVVRDELVGHVPLWFPAPAFDDPSQMPVSREILNDFARWNDDYNRVVNDGPAAVEVNSQQGIALAERLAEELGNEYEVHIRLEGISAAGTVVIRADSDQKQQ